MTKIKLQKLTKIFGEEVAVNSFDLVINDSEFLVLVGPSGCGKSTTLRMIAGLEQATTGSIFFDEKEITDFPPKERNVGMVFQSYALYPHMTIAENLSFGLRLQGVDRMVIKDKVTNVAKLLGIEDQLTKKPKQLSGGQRQRVALGRAIIRDPACFLFDEPLSNLDAKLRVQMRAEIQRLQRRTKITSIYVTHDQVEAMSMADRIAIMNKGIVQQVGSPEEVYSNPTNKFVASFIGSPEMNIIEGKILRENSSWFVETVIGKVPVDKQIFNLEGMGGEQVYFGVRPEHLEVQDKGAKSQLQVMVDVVEPLGADTFMYAKLGDTQFSIRTKGIFQTEFEEELKIGLNVDPANIHLFNYKTEETLKISDIKEKEVVREPIEVEVGTEEYEEQPLIPVSTTSQKVSDALQTCPNCDEYQSVLIRTCTNCKTELPYCNICKRGFSDNEQKLNCNNCNNPFHRVHLLAYIQSKGNCPVCKKHLSVSLYE